MDDTAGARAGERARMGAVRVSRVTLPRYNVEYTNPKDALEDAKHVKDKGILIFGDVFPEPPGCEIVFDVYAAGVIGSVTLLFRVLTRQAQSVTLQWWPRREIDRPVVDLWIESLRQHIEPDTEVAAVTPEVLPLRPTEKSALLALCRQLCTTNPFTAMGISWTFTRDRVLDGIEAMRTKLALYEGRVQLGTDLHEAYQTALRRFKLLENQLANDKMRRMARAKFVPHGDIQQTAQLLKHQHEVAVFRDQHRRARELLLQLEELGHRGR